MEPQAGIDAPPVVEPQSGIDKENGDSQTKNLDNTDGKSQKNMTKCSDYLLTQEEGDQISAYLNLPVLVLAQIVTRAVRVVDENVTVLVLSAKTKPGKQCLIVSMGRSLRVFFSNK